MVAAPVALRGLSAFLLASLALWAVLIGLALVAAYGLAQLTAG